MSTGDWYVPEYRNAGFRYCAQRGKWEDFADVCMELDSKKFWTRESARIRAAELNLRADRLKSLTRETEINAGQKPETADGTPACPRCNWPSWYESDLMEDDHVGTYLECSNPACGFCGPLCETTEEAEEEFAKGHEMNSQPSTDTNVQSDDAAVYRFAAAMKKKLALARAKGRSGWQECDPADLVRMLHEHIEKGDPVDVANFCMFLWSLGHPITPFKRHESFERAWSEWMEKTEFIQDWFNEGKLSPANYLGMHRADVMRDLIEKAQVAREPQSLRGVSGSPTGRLVDRRPRLQVLPPDDEAAIRVLRTLREANRVDSAGYTLGPVSDGGMDPRNVPPAPPGLNTRTVKSGRVDHTMTRVLAPLDKQWAQEEASRMTQSWASTFSSFIGPPSEDERNAYEEGCLAGLLHRLNQTGNTK